MVMTKRQKFTVGLDWLISEDGKPFLLEFNMSRENAGNDTLYLRPFHFFKVSLDKILQYNLLGEFMPDSILDEQGFDEFIKRKFEESGKDFFNKKGGVSVTINPPDDYRLSKNDWLVIIAKERPSELGLMERLVGVTS